MAERRAQSPSRTQSQVRIASAVIVLVPLALVIARCSVSEAVPWVVPSASAPWIMAPAPVSADLEQWGRSEVEPTRFTTHLRATGVAPGARLQLRSLGDARVLLDGVEIGRLERVGARGRAHASVPIRLAAGRELQLEVEVRNAYGPGLLALTSEGVTPPITTGSNWYAALGEAPLAPALVADDTRRNPRALAVETPREALAENAPMLLVLCVLGGALFAAAGRAFAATAPAVFGAAVPVVASGAWLGPLAAKLWSIPTSVGFDAKHHLLYAKQLLASGSLPDAAAGWSSYHPPLFHALAAGLLAVGGGAAALKSLMLLAGIASIWVAWALVRRLAPETPAAAGLAALFAAVLPVNLYSSAYLSNEALHATFGGAALLAVVAALLSEQTSLRALAGIGLLLAAAALTKFTVLVVVPVALFFLAWKLLGVERLAPARAARGLLVFTAVVAFGAGWFYLRTYLAHGTPVMGNWNLPGAAQRWWHQPGFHTPAYYLSFGEALVHPYLAGFRSFWDALYSTAWGDGFIAGRTDPWDRHAFWNYSYMSAGYWLALPATLLLGVGVIALARQALRDGEPRKRLAIGFLLTASWAVALAFTSLTFELALFGQAKAAYALLLTAPAALAFARGYGWLHAGLPGWARLGLAGWLSAFAGALFLGFVG